MLTRKLRNSEIMCNIKKSEKMQVLNGGHEAVRGFKTAGFSNFEVYKKVYKTSNTRRVVFS